MFLQDNTNKKELFALLTSRVAVSREQGSKHYLGRICYLKKRVYRYTEMRPRGSGHHYCCTYSTRAEQRIQSGFCPRSGYGYSCHNDWAFSWHHHFISVCSCLDWFGYGEICPIHHCKSHLHISWPWNISVGHSLCFTHSLDATRPSFFFGKGK